MATSTSTTLPASRKLQRAGNRCPRFEQGRKIESGQEEKEGLQRGQRPVNLTSEQIAIALPLPLSLSPSLPLPVLNEKFKE